MPNRKTPALTKYRPKTVASNTPRRRHCISIHPSSPKPIASYSCGGCTVTVIGGSPPGKDRPKEGGRGTVVVTDKEATDASEQMSERERRRCHGKDRNDRPPLEGDVGEANSYASDQATVPTQAAAREKQFQERRFGRVFNCPQQLRAGEAADDSDKAGIGGVEWHSRPAQLPPKQPQAHQRGESPPLSS